MRQILFSIVAIVWLIFSSLSVPALADAGACDEAGSLARESYRSAVDEGERRYTVYLPPCYAADETSYPLLTLLHGSDADDQQWSRLGFIDALDAAIRAGTAIPIVVVMPNGGTIANENHFDGATYDAILLDFIAQMAARYRSNGRHGIGGISRGGFWAYHLGLRYADKFVALGGHSPYFDAEHAAPAYNPLNLAQSLNADTHLKLWLDRGTSDYAADGVEAMHVALQRRRVPHQHRVFAGGSHSENSWRHYVPEYVDFYASALAGDEGDAPSSQGQAAGYELWLPAAGFGALLTSIDSEHLAHIVAGGYDQRLVLSESARLALGQRGVEFHGNTRLVENSSLFSTLWRNKRLYTLLPFDQLRLQYRPLWLDDMPVVDQLDSYPLAFESAAPNFMPSRLTRITVSGTTALARHTLPAIDAIGVDAAASGIRDYVLRSDFFHITNEASIVPDCPQATGRRLAGDLSMCMKSEHLRLFELLDVDIVDLTGNHINDFGFAPLRETIGIFELWGMHLVGGGLDEAAARQPLILQHNGSRIGWLACNDVGPNFAYVNDDPQQGFGARAGAAACERPWLRSALGALAAEVDQVLLTVHYREFEQYLPQDGHRFDYKTFAEWGADIVLGTAEHKPMTFEFYPTQRGETAFIHYGLGNLFFDQLPWGNRRFFLDTLYIYDGKLLAVELFPGIIDDRARPRLLEGEDLYNFLHFMFIQKNEF